MREALYAFMQKNIIRLLFALTFFKLEKATIVAFPLKLYTL